MKKYILLILISLLFISPVYANDLEGVPTTGVKYTLTYPDGSTVETTDYNEVVEAFKEENWKDLGTYKTNEEGIILLENYISDGTLKIVEKEIPVGYTAEKTTFIVPVKDAFLKVINKKKDVYGEIGNPNTGDMIYISLIVSVTSMAITLYMIKKIKQN